MNSSKWRLWLGAGCLMTPILMTSLPANATYTLTISDDGVGTVSESGSGTLKTSGLTAAGGPPYLGASINPNGAQIFVGPTAVSSGLDYFYVYGPSSLGTGSTTVKASSGSGSGVGLYYSSVAGAAFLIVPSNYLSGGNLSSSATFSNQSLSSLGLSVGSYVYSLSGAPPDQPTRPVDDTFVINVQGTSVTVPEPSSLALIIGALASSGGVGFSRIGRRLNGTCRALAAR